MATKEDDKNMTTISVCCWNIDGLGPAKERKTATNATFKKVEHSADKSAHEEHTFKLGESDIICVQELTCNPTPIRKGNIHNYFPFARDKCGYKVVNSVEPGRKSKYNAVYYNEIKFFDADVACLQQVEVAYELMALKKEYYERIDALQGENSKVKAVKGSLSLSQVDKSVAKLLLLNCR